MDYLKTLSAIAAEHGGVIETKQAAQRGISRAMLSKLCQRGLIQRVTRGQYVLPDDLEDELLSISRRSRYLVFSHETALYLHGISDRTPFVHAITVPSDHAPSTGIKQQCKVYYIQKALFDLGKCTLITPEGNEVPGYDLERTICDVVRSRSRIGTETLLSALKLYARDERKDLNRLNRYAKLLHTEAALHQYLEVLL